MDTENQQSNNKLNFLAVQTPSQQINQDQQISKDQENKEKYQGLANIGATCYMNSILQTLFMTPEFRKNIFQWKFNEKVFKEEDCILFQLQKLFSKLQIQQGILCDTKDLIKSFQWDSYQAFEQHDVQEFIRILFDAIENTIQGSQNEDFIKQMYQGNSQSYIKCTECDRESAREEQYYDIIITVKNSFDKIYNKSLELGLQRYLKPEILEGDNAYQCENCDKKVKAIKGCKFISFPKVLTVLLNRFTFDFFTMDRIKLNDFVDFPFVLNLNDYINGYDGIKNKQPEENVDPKYFDNNTIIKPTKEQIQQKLNKNKFPSKTTYKKSQVKAKTTGTRDFIKNMRKQNKNLQQNNDILFLEASSDQNQPPKIIYSEISKNQKENQPEKTNGVQDNNEIDKNQQKTNIDQKMEIEPENKQQNQAENQTLKSKTDNEQQIQKADQNKSNQQSTCGKTQEEPSKEEKQKQIKEQQEQYEKELLEAFNKQEKLNQEKIQEYKKDGDLVYELYSILVHSGGAYGGHYYVLIKSFEDHKWYSFNDTRVTQFDLRQIAQETQGGQTKNAYMLFYRQVTQENQQVQDLQIPQYIQDIIEKEKVKQEIQIQLEKEKSQLITVRVYYKLDVKLITLSKQSTLEMLYEKAFDIFNLKDLDNTRIRAYKPATDSMLETYTGKFKETLESLKIGHFKNLCIETKQDNEKFEEYDNSKMDVKICLWNDKIDCLDEKQLDLQPVKINKDYSLPELYTCIAEFSKIPLTKLSISLKHQSHGFACAEVVSIEQNKDSTLEELNIFESTILYIEEKIDNLDLQWPKEFESEQHRLAIKFNTPIIQNEDDQQDQVPAQQEFPNTIVIDSRLTVTDLKQKICQQLQISTEQIIMRRGARSGQEIKEGRPTSLKGQHFVNASCIYLEYGKPAREGEFRLQICYAKNSELNNDTCFYEFQEIGELPVPGTNTSQQAQEHICKYVNEVLNLQLDPKLIRLRERISNRLSKIYRNRPLKDQQLIDKKLIAVEQIGYEQILSVKEHMVVIRIWNQDTWELSERFEIVIQKSDSGFDLAKAIYEYNQSIEIDNMEATKINAIWNFNKYDLLSAQWHKVNNANTMLGSQPFHIMNDGYLIIVKDSTKQPRELTEEEIQKMGVIVTNNKNTGSRLKKNPKFGGVQKEKGLSITVKKNTEAEKNKDKMEIEDEQKKTNH